MHIRQSPLWTALGSILWLARHVSNDFSIDPSYPSIKQCVGPLIHSLIDGLIDQSIYGSIDSLIDPSMGRSIRGLINPSIDCSIVRSIESFDPNQNRSVVRSFNRSFNYSFDGSISFVRSINDWMIARSFDRQAAVRQRRLDPEK